MRRAVVRYMLLNKRLFKKWSFLLILCIVPLLVLGLRLAAQGESGVVTVALYAEDETDPTTAGILEKLKKHSDVIRYLDCADEEEARAKVENFEADAAWIIPEDVYGRLFDSAAHKNAEPVVTAVERENSVILLFSREILCNALYPFFSYEIYSDYVRDDLGIEIDEAQLRKAYDDIQVENSLFKIEYYDGQALDESSYLLAPVRGMLAVWLMLCGFAGAMYFMQDEERGTFDRMTAGQRFLASFGYNAVILSDAVVVMVVSLRLSGSFTDWPHEIVSAVLFACCALVFCSLVRIICGTMERLGFLLPVLLMGTAVICPVFIRINGLNVLKQLLPPYYYLNSLHGTYYWIRMAVYICAAVLFSLGLWLIKLKTKKSGS